MITLRLVTYAVLCAGLAIGCASPGLPAASVGPSAASTAAGTSPSPTPTTPASPSLASPSLALPTPVDIEAAGALTITDIAADWVVMVDGRAWIAGPGSSIWVFDASGNTVRKIPVGGSCESMDTGFGAVWSASCTPAGMYRVNPKTYAVDRVDFDDPIVDSEASVGAGEGAVWVVAGAKSELLLGIDSKSLKVAHRFTIPAGGAGVRAGYGGVWVTMPYDDKLIRVDPTSGKVVATIPVGGGPRFLAVGEGSVWVMNQTPGTISRVDPATNKVTATIATSMQIYGGDLSVGGGSVWVRGGPELLFRIDPATNLVTEWYRPDAGSGSAAADDDAVWVTAHDVSKIWRLPLK